MLDRRPSDPHPTDPRLSDPDAAAHVAHLLHQRRDQVPAPQAGLAVIRSRTRKQRTADDALVSTEDATVPTRNGAIGGRWYLPSAPTGTVALFLHGGGWVLGDLEMNDGLARELAGRSGASILSIDYRLAPEDPHPAALHDAADALTWMVQQSPDASRVVVIGHSAGGNLAAVLAQDSGRAGLPALDGQVLLCPVLDHDLDRDSYHRFGEGLLLTRHEMEWYWDLYQPDPALRSQPSASPLRAELADPLPPATIVVAGADPLHDEAVAYAALLDHRGTSVDLLVQAGVPHLYLTFPRMPGRDKSLAVAAAAL